MANRSYFVIYSIAHTAEIHLYYLFYVCVCSFASKLLPAAPDTGRSVAAAGRDKIPGVW